MCCHNHQAKFITNKKRLRPTDLYRRQQCIVHENEDHRAIQTNVFFQKLKRLKQYSPSSGCLFPSMIYVVAIITSRKKLPICRDIFCNLTYIYFLLVDLR